MLLKMNVTVAHIARAALKQYSPSLKESDHNNDPLLKSGSERDIDWV
jgi:hypothetical protein